MSLQLAQAENVSYANRQDKLVLFSLDMFNKRQT